MVGAVTVTEERPVGAKRLYYLCSNYPAIVAGVLFTGFALLNGVRLVGKRDSVQTMRRMMRWRVFGQAATLSLAAYAGIQIVNKREHSSEK
ncbi:unnamed protein product [Calicophoron daubneyi]|uniref:HIG1 domain-containing protein n=1 Tax=Calicophoron daubneyi TaxID=300641 RepID=A0AAV2TL88_CALDB